MIRDTLNKTRSSLDLSTKIIKKFRSIRTTFFSNLTSLPKQESSKFKTIRPKWLSKKSNSKSTSGHKTITMIILTQIKNQAPYTMGTRNNSLTHRSSGTLTRYWVTRTTVSFTLLSYHSTTLSIRWLVYQISSSFMMTITQSIPYWS